MAKMTLDDLVKQLQAAHGDALEAVVLHGSAARHQDASAGAMDVLVVVRSLSDASMGAAGAATRAWMEAGNPAPLTLTSAEWKASGDIFAIEYADILSAHRVLYGALDTNGISVTRRDLRLELEREVVGKMLQLRRELMARHGQRAAERALLASAHGTIFALLRGTLRLADGVTAPHADGDAVARDVAVRAGFDAAPFLALRAHRHGVQKIKDEDAHAVLRGCHDGLQKLAAYLDQLTVDG